MRRFISEICFFLADMFFGLAELFMLLARKMRNKTVGVLVLMALSACAPQVRLDVTCVITPQMARMVMNCADAETWKEWEEKQKNLDKPESPR